MPRERPTRPFLELYRDAWAIVWWEDGKRKRSSTGYPDEGRARQALVDFESALAKRPIKQTLAEAFDVYVRSRTGKVEALKRLKEAVVPLKEILGHLRVDQIQQQQWDDYTSRRVKKRNPRSKSMEPVPKIPVSAGTLRREFNVLRAALRLAWKEGHLVKPPTLEAPRDSAPRDRYLTKAEARRLLDACETPHVRAFVALAMFTGARKGSILALTWDRVQWDTGRIDFQEPGRNLTSKRRAVVPMAAPLRIELEQAHKIRTCDYVVEWNGGKVTHGLRWSFKRLCQRAQLSWTPTPHHFKHSVASWMAMNKVPIDQAADWLATDPKTLRKVYRKFDPSYLEEVTGTFDM
jgi:integrase